MFLGFGVLGAALWLFRVPTELRWQWGGQRTQIACAVLWAIGALLGATALASPSAGRLLYVAWMSATRPLGIAMLFVGLTISFLVALPVFAFLIRRADPLRRRLTPGSTYWEPVKPVEPTIERMRRPF